MMAIWRNHGVPAMAIACILFMVLGSSMLPDAPWSIRHSGPDDRHAGTDDTPDLGWAQHEAPSIAVAALYGGGDSDHDNTPWESDGSFARPAVAGVPRARAKDSPNTTTVRLALEAAKSAELIPWSRVNISGRMVRYKVHPASIGPARAAVRHSGATPTGVLSGSLAGRNQVRTSWGQSVHAVVYFLVARAGAMDHAICGGVPCDANAGLPIAEFTVRQDLIMLDIDEKYNDVTCGGDPIGCESSLPFKTQVWLHVAHRLFPEAPFVLKTDDDCYVKVRLRGNHEVDINLAHVYSLHLPTPCPQHHMARVTDGTL